MERKKERQKCTKCGGGFVVSEILYVAEGAGREIADTCKICGHIRFRPYVVMPSAERIRLMEVAKARMDETPAEEKTKKSTGSNANKIIRPDNNITVGENIPEHLRAECGVEGCKNFIMESRNKSGMCARCAKKMRRWKERGHKTPPPFVQAGVKKWAINPERIKKAAEAAAKNEQNG